MTETLRCLAGVADTGARVDKFLNEQTGLSRTQIQRFIEDGVVSCNGLPLNLPRYRVKENDQFEIVVPMAIESALSAQEIPLDIVYEDDDLLVINKPAGMVVHPAPGHGDDTLVNALLAHCGDKLSGIGGVKRPGIVHRLDKDTSGLMVVAKNDKTHHGLSAQFADHNGQGKTLKRLYYALVWGLPSVPKATIHTKLARHPHHRQKIAVSEAMSAKEAITHYTLMQTYLNCFSLLACTLETGRTHQIRVHCQHVGLPLVGDPVYGRKRGVMRRDIPELVKIFPRQALHAKVLSFIHPQQQRQLTFECDVPSDMAQLMETLESFRF